MDYLDRIIDKYSATPGRVLREERPEKRDEENKAAKEEAAMNQVRWNNLAREEK